MSTNLLKKGESFNVPPQALIPLEYVKDYFEKANKTSTNEPSLVQKYLQKVRDVEPRVDQVIEWAEPYVPSVTKERMVFLLLLLLCYEGCSALAAILKPVFSFFLGFLPIGDRCPKKNTTYLISFKKGKKEMEEGDIPYASNEETVGVFRCSCTFSSAGLPVPH